MSKVLKQAVQDIMKEIYTGKETFKIIAKRSDHQIELTSNELNQTLGNAVVFDIFFHISKFKCVSPDIPLRVEIRRDGAYLSYGNDRKGAGGVACRNKRKRNAPCFLAGLILLVQDIFAMKRGGKSELFILP